MALTAALKYLNRQNSPMPQLPEQQKPEFGKSSVWQAQIASVLRSLVQCLRWLYRHLLQLSQDLLRRLCLGWHGLIMAQEVSTD